MHFVKENLLQQHYTWSGENRNPVFIGSASRRTFNRFNGEQVLFIINLYAASAALFTIADGQRLEKMILDELPIDTKSELSVLNWLTTASH
ncbi:MAG: hypothetical protein JNK14_14990 [Chitinophagaceae bacterium]|nr:hypothetical protein [Chitinophagaceae bacterium]